MSDDVTRLDFEHPACPGYECCGGGEMMPADNGDYVRYTDHARIVAAKDAEIAALRAERAAARKDAERWEARIKALRAALTRVRGDFRDDALCSGSDCCNHCIAIAALEEDVRNTIDAARAAEGGTTT